MERLVQAAEANEVMRREAAGRPREVPDGVGFVSSPLKVFCIIGSGGKEGKAHQYEPEDSVLRGAEYSESSEEQARPEGQAAGRCPRR